MLGFSVPRLSSTFIALPLSSGEAFLLRTPDSTGKQRNILVDGGKLYGEGKRELARRLAEVTPPVEHIDIAVCTHSDADHSQGFWFFADDWYDLGRTIGEFWLPGRWANAVPAILTEPTAFAAKLMEGAFEAGLFLTLDAKEVGPSLTREGGHYKLAMQALTGGERRMSAVQPVVDLEYDGEIPVSASLGLNSNEAEILRGALQEMDDEVDPLEHALRVSWPGPWWTGIPRSKNLGKGDAAILSLAAREARVAFEEVAETAMAIRKIAVAALARNILVRWFDFGEYERSGIPSGGVPGLLEPFCSVEVVPVPTKEVSAINLFMSLRLSRQNVESLVFYRPETKHTPGVLFLGDSRLAHGVERPEKNFPVPFAKPSHRLLVTAPHHGSDHNDRAFEVLDGWLGKTNALFVRNGGQSNQQLGAYVTKKERRCAQCVQCHDKNWRQWVAVMSAGVNWNWPPTAAPCGVPKI